ncbi:hypothetical protein KBD81_04400 [Candidatus Woesebacteria bacterium]|nr:hypothetical protein [Candidatus Woesebacteria bacterium]
MTSLNEIKKKLQAFFVSTVLDPDDVPMHIFQTDEGIFYQYRKKQSDQIWTAQSQDGFNFEMVTGHDIQKPDQACPFPQSVAVPGHADRAYYGDRSLKVARLDSHGTWVESDKSAISMSVPIQIAEIFPRHDGNLLLFYSKQIFKGYPRYHAYLALADAQNPENILWQMDTPIWKQELYWNEKQVAPLGAVLLGDTIVSYWLVDNAVIYGVAYTGFLYDPADISNLHLEKHVANPIIVPNDENNWEAFTTMNPAALYAGGQVHILYRAQGYDYVSVVGYARSRDGVTIDHRAGEPVFAPQEGFETNLSNTVNYDFMSGGSYGGCEDPRITKIDDRVYMTYVAFDGYSPPRLAMTSIHIDDFLAERWNWEKPVLISKPGVVDKSGCLLPEKINGKYVIFHRVFPNIQIDFVDDLNFDGETNFLKGEYEIKIRPDKWDSRKIGAGAPPLRTKDGWLLIYYGVDDRDDSKYLVGAMLLDINDPTKVLYRTDHPIIEPVEAYENVGFKPGIVYPCGAVIIKDQLLVYYGGADSHVCVAGAKIDEFLDTLKHDKTPVLQSLSIREISYQ